MTQNYPSRYFISGLKCKLITHSIREGWNTPQSPSERRYEAFVSLSNFEFPLNPETSRDDNFTDFYVMTLSHGVDIVTGRIVLAGENRVFFNDKFTLKVAEDFKVTLQLFCLRLRISKGSCPMGLLRKLKVGSSYYSFSISLF